MAETIHRLYCTHCAGEGYAPRTSTLEERQTTDVYQSVRSYLHYDLPEDTPEGERGSLRADTAPKRLFCARANQGVIGGQVCYRAFDTAGRTGSYFADILVQEEGKPWDPADILELWGAPGWQEEDASDIQARGLDKLSNLWQGERPLITPEFFRGLLRGETGPQDRAAAQVLPDRFCDDPRSHNWRNLFVRCFQQLLGTLEDETPVVLAAEPGLAALLFYGMVTLLPPGQLRRHLTFSTFEVNPRKIRTKLAATTFHQPQRAPSGRRPRARVDCVVDTFAPDVFRAPDPRSDPDYAWLMTEKLLTEGWRGVEQCWQALEAEKISITSAVQLEAIAHMEQTADGLLGSPDEVELPGPEDAFHGYLARRLCQRLAQMSRRGSPREALAPVPHGANYVSLLELVSCRYADYADEQERLRELVRWLLAQVPPETLSGLLEADVPEDWKEYALAASVTRAAKSREPKAWQPLVYVVQANVGGVLLLAGALARVKRETVELFSKRVKDEDFFGPLCMQLRQASSSREGAARALGGMVAPLDVRDFFRLAAADDWAFLEGTLPADRSLSRKLSELVDKLPEVLPDEYKDFEKLNRTLEALSRHQQHLLGDVKLVWKGWEACFRALREVREREMDRDSQDAPRPPNPPPKRRPPPSGDSLQAKPEPTRKLCFGPLALGIIVGFVLACGSNAILLFLVWMLYRW